jgi:ABC-type lipoprotein export system ATPase subunit
MTQSLVEVIGVTRRFESRAETVTALDDVSFTISRGEIVGLVGPSGSGKSTMLHLLVGWDTPDVGSIRRSPELRTSWSSVSTIPQDLGLLPELTARENIALALRLGGGSGVSPSALLDELEMCDLGDRRPHELSLGEQQRVAVARAVVATPDLVVADEPTAHQDESRADAVLAVLVRVARNDGAVLVATHDERLLDRVDRVLQLVDGRLVPATT